MPPVSNEHSLTGPAQEVSRSLSAQAGGGGGVDIPATIQTSPIGGDLTLSNGGTRAVSTASHYRSCLGTLSKSSGQHAFEVTVDNAYASNHGIWGVGQGLPADGTAWVSNPDDQVAYLGRTGLGDWIAYSLNGSTDTDTNVTPDIDDGTLNITFRCDADLDNGVIYWTGPGGTVSKAFSTYSIPHSAGVTEWTPLLILFNTMTIDVNFGQSAMTYSSPIGGPDGWFV